MEISEGDNVLTEHVLSWLVGLVVALVGSYYVDILYKRKAKILKFPDYVESRSRWRRPLLVLAVTGLALVSSWQGEAPIEYLPVVMAGAALMLLIAATDFEQYLIFNLMLLPLAILGLIYSLLMGWPLWMQLLGALAAGAVFLLLGIISMGGLGGGDVKLAAALGCWFPPAVLLDVLLVGTVFGGAAALFLYKFHFRTLKGTFAYGPYYVAAALLKLFWRWLY